MTKTLLLIACILVRKNFGWLHRRDAYATGGTGILPVEKTFPDSYKAG